MIILTANIAGYPGTKISLFFHILTKHCFSVEEVGWPRGVSVFLFWRQQPVLNIIYIFTN